MRYTYYPKGVCPMEINFNIKNGVVTDIRFTGGCNGNLKAISKLVNGMTADEINQKLRGNTCGRRPTSCADQLARAVMEAKTAERA
ncbi:MAG: TIGR03905 family TSCPD domain-containing protein [Ruminococcus sp.]|nr:TIGR03905 family TSCPD domain-containing protein [Ruminococcus sp.]